MTTIAWDGKTLAADRKGVAGGTPYPVCKIFDIKQAGRRVLMGGCGDWDMVVAWRRWMEGGEQPPLPNDHNIVCVMVIDEKRRIWVADGRRIYTRITLPRWAIGSGADYALSAMHCGWRATDAVRVATRLDVNSGLGVDYINFDRKKK